MEHRGADPTHSRGEAVIRVFDMLDAVDSTTVIIAAGILLLAVTIIDRHVQEGT